MTNAVGPITVREIKKWFSYDPSNGLVCWKRKPNRSIPLGRPAGFLWKSGRNTYVRICLQGSYIFAHRVAFVLSYGRFPTGEIDHVNGDGVNNKLVNLRDVSHTDNLRNQRLNVRNKSGVMGVDFHHAAQQWRGRINVNKKDHHLGVFRTKNEAIDARKLAEEKFNFHDNHGR